MAQKESQVSRKLKELLRANGFFVFKTFGSSESMSGLPDLIGCKYGRFFAVETKVLPTQGSAFRYSEKQKIRMQELREVGATVLGVGYIAKHNIHSTMKHFFIVDNNGELSQPLTYTDVIRLLDLSLRPFGA